MTIGREVIVTVAADGQALHKIGDLFEDRISAGKFWIEGDLLCERFDTVDFFGTKICRDVLRYSGTAGADAYNHFCASVTGIDRIAVIE